MRRLEGAVTSARRRLKDARVWWLLCAGMATCMAGAAVARPDAVGFTAVGARDLSVASNFTCNAA